MEKVPSNQKTIIQQHEIVHVDHSFEPLVPKFMANRKREMAAMHQAVAAKDFDTVRTISHGMKGVGGSYGFDRLTEFGATIEQAAQSADAEIIEQQLYTLAIYLDHIQIVYD